MRYSRASLGSEGSNSRNADASPSVYILVVIIYMGGGVWLTLGMNVTKGEEEAGLRSFRFNWLSTRRLVKQTPISCAA